MINKLSAAAVRGLKQPGRYGDGAGLWLQVRAGQAAGTINRSWLFRFTTADGKGHWMGLGSATDFTLAEARDKARACRREILAGRNPITDRRQVKDAAVARPFRDIAALYMAAHEAAWRNPVHRKQWTSTLDAYVYPVMGDKAVAAIDTADVLRALEPIWHEKPETATRIRGRIESVLDFAGAKGWRDGANPARWKGHLKNLLPARAKISRATHHAAEPWATVAGFMADLRQQGGTAARALEFTILTAARTGEVIGATWDEIDLEAKAWTVGPEAHESRRATPRCAVGRRRRDPGPHETAWGRIRVPGRQG